MTYRTSISLTISLFAAAAVVMPAQSTKKPATSKHAKRPAEPAVKNGSHGLVVFKDPVTGEIRQPDAAEIGALIGTSRSDAAVTTAPVMIQGPGNAVGAVLGDDSLAYMVVTKTAEGKLSTGCVTGKAAAQAQAASGQISKKAVAKEVLDVQ